MQAPATVTLGVLWALVAYACFATGDALVKMLSATIAVPHLVFFMALFSLPLVALIWWRDREAAWPARGIWWLVLLRAVVASGTGFFAFNAFARLPLADAYTMIFTIPLWVTLLSVPLLGERLGWRRPVAVALGFVGVVIILEPSGAAIDIGHGFAGAAALCAALTLILVRVAGTRVRGSVHLVALMLVYLTATAPSAILNPPTLTTEEIVGLVALGFFGGMAHHSVLSALAHAPASMVAPFQYSQLLWAVIYGWVLFGDWPRERTLIGAAIIIASGLYILHRERRRHHRPDAELGLKVDATEPR